MTKIQPTNGHILIEPVVHEEFMLSERNIYEQIGRVIALPTLWSFSNPPQVKTGDKVYFDSWLAAKYPKEGGKSDEFYWLVKWEDVRAVEYAESPISK